MKNFCCSCNKDRSKIKIDIFYKNRTKNKIFSLNPSHCHPYMGETSLFEQTQLSLQSKFRGQWRQSECVVTSVWVHWERKSFDGNRLACLGGLWKVLKVCYSGQTILISFISIFIIIFYYINYTALNVGCVILFQGWREHREKFHWSIL